MTTGGRLALATLALFPIGIYAQTLNCVYNDPAEDDNLECAASCSGTNGQTSVATESFGGYNPAYPNSIYTAQQLSFSCGRSANGTPCSSISYYVVSENNVACGFCPDCGNPNCSNYVSSNCCDQTNGSAECNPNICYSCDNTCAAPGTVGYACCTTPDCAQGLLCINGACSPPPSPPTCGPAGTNCTNSDCVPPSCPPGLDWNPALCECYQYSTPIIIDTDGSGFHLTSAANGVLFDFFGDGKSIRIAWTDPGSTNGWLALDRDGNGKIDSGKELFGNVTTQPLSSTSNGFLALAVFDQPDNGGNGDGVIDNRDAVWPKLLVWIDANHDGVSQPEELHHLDDLGIHSIGLMYTESRRVDAYGNEFRYKGFLNLDGGDEIRHVIYDVMLTTLN